MYQQRLKIFIILCIIALSACLTRLVYLQVFQAGKARTQIEQLRILPPQQLPTLRGKIIDRNGQTLALDKPVFFLNISYQLTRLLDDRFWQERIRRKTEQGLAPAEADTSLKKEFAPQLAELHKILNFSLSIAEVDQEELDRRIAAINERIWEFGRFIFWRRINPGAPYSQYNLDKNSISAEQVFSINLTEMLRSYPLLELADRSDLIGAQIELANLKYVSIKPQPQRFYPFGKSACHIIGWVGPVQKEEMKFFSDDQYLRYLDGETLGKFGIEKACEVLLRGRRGEITYDREQNLIDKQEARFGSDIQLSLDISLQRKIETFFTDPNQTPKTHSGLAAVVLDASGGDILAMVSTPMFDLNNAGQNYDTLLADSSRPLRHKAVENNYPPGSAVKPFILIAGLEEKKISAAEVIHCSYQLPPPQWPRCLLQRSGYCHDARWEEEGQVNIARNALRGSCNVYFSRLADRIDSDALPKWLSRFGFGTDVLPDCVKKELSTAAEPNVPPHTSLPQAHGSIAFGIQEKPFTDADSIPPIPSGEKRWWGIGQGNLRVTVLQLANAYAVLARGGLYKPSRLVLDESDPANERHARPLPISKSTMQTVLDGLHAVVNELGGTAYNAFDHQFLKERKITLYGKTGSTETPENAWFAGFATDQAGRALAIAVIVQGGQRGSSDAAPLAQKILSLCTEAGCIGQKITPQVQPPAQPPADN